MINTALTQPVPSVTLINPHRPSSVVLITSRPVSFGLRSETTGEEADGFSRTFKTSSAATPFT